MIACVVGTTAAGLYQHSVASQLRAKADAHDRRCRYVSNALRSVQLDLENRRMIDEPRLRVGRDPGLSFDEIEQCTLYKTNEPYAPLVACLAQRDDACAIVEITKLRGIIRDIEQR